MTRHALWPKWPGPRPKDVPREEVNLPRLPTPAVLGRQACRWRPAVAEAAHSSVDAASATAASSARINQIALFAMLGTKGSVSNLVHAGRPLLFAGRPAHTQCTHALGQQIIRPRILGPLFRVVGDTSLYVKTAACRSRTTGGCFPTTPVRRREAV